MKDEDKCRALLTHIARPINLISELDARTQAELAKVYDDCLPDGQIAMRDGFDQFWAKRLEQLKTLKATSPESDAAELLEEDAPETK